MVKFISLFTRCTRCERFTTYSFTHLTANYDFINWNRNNKEKTTNGDEMCVCAQIDVVNNKQSTNSNDQRHLHHPLIVCRCRDID